MNRPRHAVRSEALPEVPDLYLPSGCPACGGDLAVRIRADGARGVCRACRSFSRPRVAFVEDGLEVEHLAAARA